jgi:hypothetical protein
MPLVAWCVEDLDDGHSLADQRRGELASGRDELFELAFDIKSEQYQAQLFRILGKSRRFGRTDRRNLGSDAWFGRKTRRRNLAWGGRTRRLLRLSQLAHPRNKKRPKECSSEKLQAVPHITDPCSNLLRELGQQLRETWTGLPTRAPTSALSRTRKQRSRNSQRTMRTACERLGGTPARSPCRGRYRCEANGMQGI